MKPLDLVKSHLKGMNIIQLATSSNNAPYLCTVHFYNDKELNFYWLSAASRRHSKEIEQNKNICVYVLVHENTSEEDYVIGISFEGEAQEITKPIDRKSISGYVEKFHERPSLVNEIIEGSNQFKRVIGNKTRINTLVSTC